MKVAFPVNLDDQEKVENITYGNCFTCEAWPGTLFMLIDNDQSSLNRGFVEEHAVAVNLETGELRLFGRSELVHLRKASVVIYAESE